MKKAPDFALPDQLGVLHTLADYSGKWIVLYFYPKDDTPGCTKEACSFRDERDLLLEQGAEVLGVSRDSVASHKAFVDKYELTFTLLSDPSGEVIDSYGALTGEGKIQRKTFLINPSGQIIKEYLKVTPDQYVAEVQADLKALVD